jgi:hypothetical protein
MVATSTGRNVPILVVLPGQSTGASISTPVETTRSPRPSWRCSAWTTLCKPSDGDTRVLPGIEG